MSSLLEISKSGLFTSKKALETTGHNIANANTEGYTRQRAHIQHSDPVIKQGVVIGTGSQVAHINRIHDENLEKGINKALTNHHFFKEQSFQLDQIEQIFNDIDQEGLQSILNKFYNSFRQLANQPENKALRLQVRENARLIINDFRRIRKHLDQTSYAIDRKISSIASDINEQVNSIAKLNVRIKKLEGTGNQSGDLRDQRDMAVRKLSEYFKLNTYHDDRGSFVVGIGGIGGLVTGGITRPLQVSRKSRKESSNNMANSAELYFKRMPSMRLSERIKGGRLASLFELRNEHIRSLQDSMDNIAFELAKMVNGIHRRGVVARNIPLDENKDPKPLDQYGPTTGIDFFSDPKTRHQAASHIDLSSLIKDDITNLATALSPNSPGDNRIALAISKLQNQKVMDHGTSSLEEYYLKNIGHTGLKAAKARFEREQSQGILRQVNSIKEKISGVSIDEEAANMIKYQNAYQASAKVMSTADEMFRAVLNIIP